MRGTPSRSGQARGQLPVFSNSAASNIPRPAQDSHATNATTPNTQSEVGGSSMSASRAKQSKRDEVRYIIFRLLFHLRLRSSFYLEFRCMSRNSLVVCSCSPSHHAANSTPEK